MKQLIGSSKSQIRRSARLTASTLAVVTAFAVAGAQANAAPHGTPPHPPKPPNPAKIKHPKLKHGVLTIEGSNSADRIALRLKAGDPTLLQIDVGDDGSADFEFARPDVSSISVEARDGDDAVRIDDANGAFTDSIPTTIDGGDGDDTLAGGLGAETFRGGDGNDSIDGNRGNDVGLMGDGDDTFTWDPGDGSDTVEGQAGVDTMLFNGAKVGENVDLSANGSRLRFFRDIGNITMDADGVETVDFRALGGTDTTTINDLTGTAVTAVRADLAAAAGGGDGQADRVIVNGTSAGDAITVTGGAGAASVTGLAAAVSVANAEPAADTLTINTLAGIDRVDASGLAATAVKLELNGGDDADTLAGSAGGDLVNGGRGNNVALLGGGDDTFVWNPGDGSDTFEGQADSDRMTFNGANVNERIDLSANGPRLRLFRDVGNITMDTAGVETVDVNALGGADAIIVGDLSGTGVTKVNGDLAATGGAGDGQPDCVTVDGTNGDDVVTIGSDASGVTVLGLAATVAIAHAESASDGLTVNGLAGDDVLLASGLDAGSIELTLDGGPGDDILVGGEGNDTQFGREGDDVLVGGPGVDILDGGPGDNILIQD